MKNDNEKMKVVNSILIKRLKNERYKEWYNSLSDVEKYKLLQRINQSEAIKLLDTIFNI